MFIRIDSVPSLLFHVLGESEPDMAGVAFYPRFLSAGPLRRTLGGENANVTATLDNADGQLTALFAVPPLRARATLYLDADTPMFTGAISEVTLDDTVTLGLEA